MRISGLGLIKFRTNQTSYLTKILFWERKKEFEYTSIFLRLIKKVTTFVDVGANIGYYTVLGAKANRRLQVIAFEPSVGPMIYLSENVKLNKIENQVSIEVLALSNKKGTMNFHEIKNNKYPHIYNLSGEHNLGTKPSKNHFKVKVDTNTLDMYYLEHPLPTIDLIKLDTEGNEHLILSHAKAVVTKFRPIIICETLYNTIEESLEKIMLQYHYEFFNHQNNKLVKVESIKRETDNSVRNCFFVPKEKIDLINEFL